MQNTFLSIFFIFLLSLILVISIVFKKHGRIVAWLSLFCFIIVGTFIQYLGISYLSNTEPRLNFMKAFFSAVKMVGGDFKDDQLSALMKNNLWYYWSVLLVQSLVLINSIIVVIGLLGKRVFNQLRLHLALKSKKTYIIIGDNSYSNAFLNSIECQTQEWINDFSNKKMFNIQKSLIRFYRRMKLDVRIIINLTAMNEVLLGKFFSRSCRPAVVFGDFNTELANKLMPISIKGEIRVISFIDDDRTNMIAIEAFSRRLDIIKNNPHFRKLDNTDFHNSGFVGHFMYSDYNQARLMEIIKCNNACIQLFSRHELITRAFVDKYPLTKLVLKEDIVNGALVSGKYNYFFLGFGKTNKEILRKMMINNQFNSGTITYHVYCLNSEDEESIFLRPIRYFHKENAFLSSEYLTQYGSLNKPLFHSYDVRGFTFYNSLLDNKLSSSKLNIFIIALGEDIVNIKVAHELEEYLSTDLKKRSHIFPKTSNIEGVFNKNTQSIICPIGHVSEIFSSKYLIDENTDILAKTIHRVYQDQANKHILKKNIKVKEWKELDLHTQDSNRSVATNIRTKLNLIGFDFKKSLSNTTEIEIQNNSIFEVLGYTKSSFEEEVPIFENKNQMMNYYNDHSIRLRMAEQEHLRWIAYEILSGWVPMPISTLKKRAADIECSRPHADDLTKQHACITTEQGLLDLFEILVENGRPASSSDKIVYDYTTLKYLPDILKKAGLVLYKLH